MTAFEYFKERYDANHDYMVKCISKDVPVDSFRFVEIAWKNCWGGTVDVDPWFNINGVENTKEMLDAKMLTKWDGHDRKRHIALTKKGLKAFYKEMF